MQRKSPHRSAFFNLRVLIALVVFLTGIFTVLFAAAGPWEAARQADAQVRTPNGFPFAPTGAAQQAWVARYDGPGHNEDIANAIGVDASGNVYVTGQSDGGDGIHYSTIKYSSAGQEQWVARYNGPANSFDVAQAIAVDGSGNAYVTGESTDLNSGVDYATIKYNTAGKEQWVARYNGPANSFDVAEAIALDNASNVYVTGSSEGPAGNADYATVVYNFAGQQQWVARYNGPGLYTDEANAIVLDGFGNVYVTGSSVGFDGSYDYATIKYNSTGQQQWVVRYNNGANDYAHAIAVDGSGNVYVTGLSVGLGTDFDYATIKYDASGQEQWVTRYNGPGNYEDRAEAIAVDGSGNVYVAGSSFGLGTYDDYVTIKYNSAGQEQWVARYDGPGSYTDSVTSMAIDGLGDIYVTGGSFGADSDLDCTTIKYGSAGQQEWLARYSSPGNSADAGVAMALDSSGNVYVTGPSQGPGSGHDYATIKYVQEPTRPAPTPRVRPSPKPRPTP